MSVHEVQRFLFAANHDPSLAAAFTQQPEDVVATWPGDLTVDERRLLVERDVVGLYRHGVHGVLLAVSSGTLGLSPPDIRRRLKSAYGFDESGRLLPAHTETEGNE